MFLILRLASRILLSELGGPQKSNMNQKITNTFNSKNNHSCFFNVIILTFLVTYLHYLHFIPEKKINGIPSIYIHHSVLLFLYASIITIILDKIPNEFPHIIKQHFPNPYKRRMSIKDFYFLTCNGIIGILFANLTLSFSKPLKNDSLFSKIADAIGILLLQYIWTSVWFYFSHVLFHSPCLYKYHKIHHLSVYTDALDGLVSHPLEFVCNAIGSTFLFQLICPLPIQLTAAVHFIFVYSTMISHIGYSFKNQYINEILLINRYHAMHHKKQNTNFGLDNGFLDKLFDTLYLEEH